MSWLDHRIPPPILVAVIGATMWVVAQITPPMPLGWALRLACASGLLLVGWLFLISGFLAFRRARTTISPVDPAAASSLVVTGVYRYTRNPMYVGFALTLLGWSAWLSAPWAWLGPALFCVFIDRFQIAPEERALFEKFGPSYKQYLENVHRWL